MNSSLDIDGFRFRLANFNPETHITSRCLALYSASLAIADGELMSGAVERGQKHDVKYGAFYEIVLQSYLFLGFPRMLIAAQHLGRTMPHGSHERPLPDNRDADLAVWRTEGERLCRQIYGAAYEPLRGRVQPVAPEIFEWMIVEGYGKVLSRPGLDLVSRELSIVAFLMAENRSHQLHSHMRGALHVGATIEQLELVVDDFGEAAGDGYRSACVVLERLRDEKCDG